MIHPVINGIVLTITRTLYIQSLNFPITVLTQMCFDNINYSISHGHLLHSDNYPLEKVKVAVNFLLFHILLFKYYLSLFTYLLDSHLNATLKNNLDTF